MRARCIKLACLAACSLFSFSALAGDHAVTSYEGTSSQSPIKRGCSEVIFVMVAFQGTIGNATYVATSACVPIGQPGDNQTLNDISYTVTGGHLYIIEVR
jgi:hypothetical protein